VSTYQPQPPLIEMLPGLKPKRLGEIELGRLVLTSTGIAIRADALSRAGDITEGVVRLGGGPLRFERHGLDETLVAIEIEYVLEPDLTGAAVGPAEAGDLIVPPTGGAGLVVTGPWQGFGILDLPSAVARPFAQQRAAGLQLTLAWQLVHREERRRIIFARDAREPRRDPLPRYASERNGDEVPRYTRDRQNRGVPRYAGEEED
jgi:hypothetical protein